MKTLFTTFAIVLVSLTSFAQNGINYKALIKDDNGNVVASQNITVQFQILQGAGMANVYQETHTPTTDANGLIMVNISEGTTNDVFAAIDWGADDHYLNVQINTGSGLTDMGTTQFMAVPYALNAANVATKLNDLSDAKSDANGSSLFLGKDAGLNDDGQGSIDNKNVGIGFQALFSNVSGTGNVGIGFQALFSNLGGSYNTANGFRALNLNTTGSYNTANGYNALLKNNTGDNNTANGFDALTQNTEGSENTANGLFSLNSNTTGNQNTANGSYTLYGNTTSSWNTATGFKALFYNTTGYSNVANGYYALYSNRTGYYNTATGVNALRYKRGNENTAIGHDALSGSSIGNNSGNNNIGIGHNAQSSSTTVSNEVTIGNAANNVYRMYAGSWTNASDSKLKHGIKNIPVGLEFVLQLRPVEFVYNNANNEEKTFGFIAQEVQEVVKQSNLEDDILVSPLNEKYLGLRTTELISVLTKAIQEQQEIIQHLKDENKQQNQSIEKLRKRVEQMELVSNQ